MNSEKEQVLQAAITGATLCPFGERTKLNRQSMNNAAFLPKETPTNADRKDLSTAFGAKPALPKNAKKAAKENPAQATLDVGKLKEATKQEVRAAEEAIQEKSAETNAQSSGEDKKKSDVPIGPSPSAKTSQAMPAKQSVQPSPAAEELSPEKAEVLASPKLDTKKLVSDAMAKICPNDNLPVNKAVNDQSGHANAISVKFRERIAKHMESEMKFMTDEDKKNFADPLHLSEFSQPIFENLKKQEAKFMVDPTYISKVQTEIRDTSRAFLLEWIIDVHRKFRLQPESLYVTQLIIDQYLSKVKIQKSQLHLLGVSTLLIATKYEEIYPPELRELLAISENKFTKEQVLKMEKEILMQLGFVLTAPSAYRFLQRYRMLSRVYQDKEVFFYGQYILEVSLLDASLLQFKPSELAAASLILAATQLRKTSGWTEHMEKFTGYSKTALKKPADEVKSFALEINPKFISTLRYKFSKAEYMKVANHTFSF